MRGTKEIIFRDSLHGRTPEFGSGIPGSNPGPGTFLQKGDIMTERRLVVTRCDSNAERLGSITHPIIECYAEIWKADFAKLAHTEDWMADYELCHYRILKLYDLLDEYDRIMVIDTDVVIMPGCPDPFETVDQEKIGSIYEDVGSRKEHRRHVIRHIQNKFGDVGWEQGYINTGVFIVSKKHKPIFQRINGKLWTGFGYDDALLGWQIHKHGFEVQELPFKWNHMSMFSEPWNNNASRFDSYIIHYAGTANFPDDKSTGRKTGTNHIADRTLLIQSDIDRITKGLMTFENTKPVEKQGGGSYCYISTIGVQKKPVILKVPSTIPGLEREVENYLKKLPYTAEYYGLCEDPNIGKFLMFEPVGELPEKINADLMKQIATKSLIFLRECYKKDVPWICRLDHIRIDKKGLVKFIDLNDEPLPNIPFYGYGGDEAIIMDGQCDGNGIYLDRSKYPRSGWWAIMSYLIKKNKLDIGILYEAEYRMVEREYQALKDVHQPIFVDEYKDILRTETEPNDPNYGKLVKPNRSCVDRAEMIITNLNDHDGETWLDIGCNVGWFCFQFDQLNFQMTGIDFDSEKIEFCKMIAEDQKADIEFKHDIIDIEYVRAMPNYDIISALSTLHLKLIKDKDEQYFRKIIGGISEKVNNVFYFEYPAHAYSLIGASDVYELIKYLKHYGKYEDVFDLGISDANRHILKCIKP